MAIKAARHFDHHWDRSASMPLHEFFEIIEKRWSEWPNRGITAEEMAEKTGLSLRSARTKLSHYSNYWDEDRQCFRHYLVRVHLSIRHTGGQVTYTDSGVYIPGPDWWGEIIMRDIDRMSGIVSCKETEVDKYVEEIALFQQKHDNDVKIVRYDSKRRTVYGSNETRRE
jgi:hypothetical protein